LADPARIVSLNELAVVVDLTEPTLRKLIKENRDFPVLSFGRNGVAYEFDATLVQQWIAAREAKVNDAQRARSDEVQQFRLDLLGDDAASDQAKEGLSPAERKQLMEEELVAIKLAERKGELIRKASIEAAIEAVIVKDAQRRGSFAARLSKRIELPRNVIAELEVLQDMDRKAFARELGQLDNMTDVDAAIGADPAV
jgi:phage terminase Nu1 subunit (DNA packaging protein)